MPLFLYKRWKKPTPSYMKILAFLSLIYAIVTEVISFLEAQPSINYSNTLWVMSYAKKERCLEENRADFAQHSNPKVHTARSNFHRT